MGGRADLSRGVAQARSQRDKSHVDSLEHALEVVKDLVICEAQNVIALCGERGRASGVAGNLTVCCVGRAINFDDHPRLEAGKVGHEAAQNNLATESEVADLLAPEALP